MLRLIVYLLLVSAFLPISKGFTASSLISFPQTSLPHRRVPTFSVASKSQRSKISNPFLLTTTAGSDHDDVVVRLSPLARAAGKFRARPLTYLTIPIIAAGVGWFTNWLAVQMIFYPIHFMGIPLYRRPEMPLGLLGWQGIIPCKTRPMTIALVDMVTSQLLTVPEAFARLDPKTVAKLLAPEVPKMTREIIHDIVPSYLQALPEAVYAGFDRVSKGIVLHLNTKFLERLTVGLQQNADSVFSLRDCVVDQMMMNRAKLGELFRKCGQAELDFLTNSGLWFGFLLGIIQMAVALFWDNPWSLSMYVASCFPPFSDTVNDGRNFPA